MPFTLTPIGEGDRDPNRPPWPSGFDGSHPLPQGAAYSMTLRWLDVTWTFREPEPGGACTGFDVAVFAGPDVENGMLAMPVATLDAPEARRWVAPLELRSNLMLKAAVRARYGEFRSAWAEAAVAAEFVPDHQDPQDNSAGLLRLADGTVMQWFTSAWLPGQGLHILDWPVPFPTRCHCAVATPSVPFDVNTAGLDDWLQLVSADAVHVRVYRQSTGEGAGYLRAHVVGWGV